MGMQRTEFEARLSKILKVLKETRDYTILRFRKQRGVGYANEKKIKQGIAQSDFVLERYFGSYESDPNIQPYERVLSVLFHILTLINNNLKTT